MSYNNVWTTKEATLIGTAGSDSINNGEDSVLINALGGSDLLNVSGMYVTVEAGADDDPVSAGAQGRSYA